MHYHLVISNQLKREWANLIKLSEICKNIGNFLKHVLYVFLLSLVKAIANGLCFLFG